MTERIHSYHDETMGSGVIRHDDNIRRLTGCNEATERVCSYHDETMGGGVVRQTRRHHSPVVLVLIYH